MSDNKRKPHLWCLYGISEQRLVEGLLFDEARAIVSSLGVSDLSNWLVWREDWPDWRLVENVEGLTEMIFRNLIAAPPPVPSTASIASPVKKDVFADEIKLTDSMIQLSIEESTKSGQFVVRKSRRFKKRYEISIISGQNIFDTHCIDISVGGILLEEALPDWVTGQFKVRIRKPNVKQQVELMACVIEGMPSGRESRVYILPLQSCEDEKNLEAWLAA